MAAHPRYPFWTGLLMPVVKFTLKGILQIPRGKSLWLKPLLNGMPNRSKSSALMIDRINQEAIEELNTATTEQLLYLLYDVQSEVLKILIERIKDAES